MKTTQQTSMNDQKVKENFHADLRKMEGTLQTWFLCKLISWTKESNPNMQEFSYSKKEKGGGGEELKK